MIYDPLHLASISQFWRARDAEIQAFGLVRDVERVRGLLAANDWVGLLPLALLLEHGAPADLAQTDPALFSAIERALAGYRAAGLPELRVGDLLSRVA